jgi:tetratricopeptide (TPR) repeat protein
LPYLLVGWLWYLGTLVPMIGLVQVGYYTRADRYTYLPQMGLAIALVWGAADLCRSAARRRLAAAVSALVLAVLMLGGWRQTGFWRDGETLWTHTLACTSRNWLAHNNCGVVFQDQHRLDDAFAQFQTSVEIEPHFAPAQYNFANALAVRGRLDEAAAHFQMALKLNPDEPRIDYAFAVALAQQGRLDEAIKQYGGAAAAKPDKAEACCRLAPEVQLRGNIHQAIELYKMALKVKPDYVEAHNNLAWLLATGPDASLRSGSEAIAHARRAEQLCGGRQPVVLDTLAAAYAEAGRFPEASATARRALALATQEKDAAAAGKLRRRLALYEAGKSYHEPPPAAPAPKR